MLTFQDFLAEKSREDFLLQAIEEHENSEKYKIGQLAAEFYAGNDPILEKVEKLVYDLQGAVHKNIFAPNHKIKTNYYQIFVMQMISYSLGNGITFDDEKIKDVLGVKFDHDVMEWLQYAINDGEAYAYVTENKITPMSIGSDKTKPVFVPLIDEETGAVKAGFKYWRLNDEKPLRITLYEPQGYTEYKQPYGGKLSAISDLKAYKGTVTKFGVFDDVVNAETVEGIPIVKLSFINNQSYIANRVNALSAYNALLSKLVNNSSEADLVYWVLKNCDGMDAADDAEFLINLIRNRILHLQDGVEAEPKQLVVPHEGIVTSLEILRKHLFYDFAAVDFERTAGGNITTSEIKQAYENMNLKADKVEMLLTDAIADVLKLMGYEGTTFHFTRPKNINESEAIQTALAVAPYMGEEETTRTICEIQGKIDSFEEIQAKKLAEAQSLTPMINGGDTNATGEQTE